ncbi:MAG: ankyrin repeat domain-containing protein [Bacteroidota bacterium]
MTPTYTAPEAVSEATLRCPNCQMERTGDYCSGCGHSFRIERLTFKTLLAEFARKFLSFEQGLLRTAKEMMVDPGGVARRYIDGQRKRYVNPFTYLVFGSALNLLVYRLTGELDRLVLQQQGNFITGTENPYLLDLVQNGLLFVFEHTLYLTLLMVLPMAWLLRRFMAKYGRTVAEMAVVPLYVLGHCALLGVVFVGASALFQFDPGVITRLNLGLHAAYFAWAGYGLFRTRAASVLTVVAGGIAYASVVMGVLLVGVSAAIFAILDAEEAGILHDWTLHTAVEANALDTATGLLDEGADPSAADLNTPLHVAVRHGHAEMVSLLLAHGADINARDGQGRTPAFLALRTNRPGLADTLLRLEGADLHAVSRTNTSLLMEAVEHGHFDQARWLLRQGVPVNVVSYRTRETALNLAAYHDNVDLVRRLLAAGANPLIADVDGYTPLDLAEDPAVRTLLEEVLP